MNKNELQFQIVQLSYELQTETQQHHRHPDISDHDFCHGSSHGAMHLENLLLQVLPLVTDNNPTVICQGLTPSPKSGSGSRSEIDRGADYKED
jgi:hypothetical protein